MFITQLASAPAGNEWMTWDHLSPSSLPYRWRNGGTQCLPGVGSHCLWTLLTISFCSQFLNSTERKSPKPKPQPSCSSYGPSTHIISWIPLSNEAVGINHILLLGNRKDPSGSQVQLLVSCNDKIQLESLLLTSNIKTPLSLLFLFLHPQPVSKS